MKTTILFIIINMIAGLVQTVTGFAGTPIAIPPSILLLGFESARASVTALMSFATFITAVILFKYIDFKQLGIIILFMGIGDVCGMALTKILPVKILLVIYGVMVLCIGIKKLVHPSKGNLKGGIKYIILLLAGVFQGMFSSGGPFAVLYLTSEIPDKNTFRGVNSSIWAVLNVYNIATMAKRGYYTPENLKLVLITIIPVSLTIIAGTYIGKKINKATFLKVVYALLIVSGSILIMNAFTQ